MWPGSPLERRLSAHLSRWEQDGLLRTLRSPAGIDLSSNDYLALAHDSRLVDAFRAAAIRDGVGSTGSRLLRGHREAFDAVERRFARFKGAARALYFSSGYLANLAVLTALTESGDVIFSDALNHASLIDGARLSRAHRVVFPHADAEGLNEAIKREPCAGIRFVVVESVFSMNGDVAPLAPLADVCRASEAVLIVDEAHAVGVMGPNGAGLVDATTIGDVPCVSINAAGKALGVAGAFVAGPGSLVDYLVQRARTFVYSTAPTPAVADAIEASLGIVQGEPHRRERALSNAMHLRRRLRAAGIAVPESSSPIIPVQIGDNERASAVAVQLQAKGFDVRAIRPPSVPAGTARLRLSINAGLSTEVLDRFVDVLAVTLQEAGLCFEVSS
jgi:8-amino-7-oxononanoate synthase